MASCRIWVVDNKGAQVDAGLIRLFDNKLKASPKNGYTSLLTNLLSEDIIGKGGKRISRSNPESWLRNLPYQYNGGRLRAEFIKSISAGGPGSGCKGPSCGRPPGGKAEAKQLPGQKWKDMSPKERADYLKQHTLVGDKPKTVVKQKAAPAEKIYPHSGKGAMGVGKPAGREHDERLGVIKGPKGADIKVERPGNIAPIYKKAFSKEEEEKEKAHQQEMLQYRQRLGKPTVPGLDPRIEEGGKVKLNRTMRAFDNNTLKFRDYKPGTKLIVEGITPRIGNNPPMVKVMFPHQDIVNVSPKDIRFYRTATGADIPKGELAKRYIKQEVESPEGKKLQILKERVAKERERPEWKQGQPNPDSHYLKGQFSAARGPRGNELKDIRAFDLKQLKPGAERVSVYDANYKIRKPADVGRFGAAGTTIFVSKDVGAKTGRIMEFNRDKDGHLKFGNQPPVKFNNLGHMSSYLNRRYGISEKLPGVSVAKKRRR